MLRLLTVLLAGILAGCVLAPALPAATPSPSPAPTAAPGPLPTPLPSPTPPEPTAAPPLPRPSYALSAVLDYAAHTLAVEETIIYPNRTGRPLEVLALAVEAADYPGVFTLQSIRDGSGSAIPAGEPVDNRLDLPLPQPLQPGETLTLQISYALALPQRIESSTAKPMPFGWSDRQTNLVDWYPFVAPYDPVQGWLLHPPGYYGEHQVYEAADFTVRLRLEGSLTALTLAASAPETLDGDWRTFTLTEARTFAISASPYLKSQSRQVGDTTVTAYTFLLDEVAGSRALNAAAQALELFSRLYSPYPHPSLAVVEADFLDGMEYDGLFFLSYGFYNLSTGRPDEYLVALSAHETAHQWWFSSIGNDQALEPWLDEALCTYSEKIFYDFTAPEALAWWWDYRVRYFEPQGAINDSIYNPRKALDPYPAYRAAVYLNGAVFLDELRAQIGDEAFFAFLKDYAGTYRGQIATRAGFFEVLARHTPVDLAPLVARFFDLP